MNRALWTGLALDVWHQVLDNRVFRAIAAMAALVVLATFAIGVRDDGIVLGWRFYSFADLGWTDLARLAAYEQGAAREVLVESIQMLFVDQVVGTFGVLVCLLAAAFFVPRMLERGAVDTLFSKPVSRGLLLITRYGAGLLLIALLSGLLVFGMHLGFLVRSGHSDPAFLWSLPVLLYRFALLFSVTVLFGVLTRSAMASLLLTLVFVGFNGCVHVGWTLMETERHNKAHEQGIAPAEVELKEGVPSFVRVGLSGLEVARFVLPKTTDTDALLRLVREGPPERREPKNRTGRQATAAPMESMELRWGGPWRQNAWISLGTSLAFALVILLIAVLRLGRLRF